MTTTTFVDKQTVIEADWLNDVDAAVYAAIGTGILSPTTPAEVLTNLGISPSGGSALVGFIQTGTGAVARTQQSKDRDTTSPQDFGAVADGVTDDRTAVNAALLAHKKIFGGESHYAVNGTVILKTENILSEGYYEETSTGTEFVVFPASALKITMEGVRLKSNAIAIHCNVANVLDTMLTGLRIDSGSYGVLFNQNAAGTDGVIITNFNITATIANPINWNFPNHDGKNFIAWGGIGYAGTGGVSGDASIVSIAGTNGAIVGGVHGRLCRREFIHVEDVQNRTVLSANTCESTLDNGITIINPSAAQISAAGRNPDPVCVIGQSLTHSGAVGTSSGLNLVFNADGQLHGNTVTSCMFRNFDNGVLNSAGYNVMNGVTSVACTNAISQQGLSITGGINMSIDCTNLLEGAAGAMCGRFVASAKPTAIIVKSGAKSQGAMLKGFSYPVTCAHTGGGVAENIANLFPTPTRLNGRVIVIMDNGANGASVSAVLKWDGAALTVTVDMEHYVGTYSAGTFVESGGSIFFRLTGTTALVAVTASMDFEGIYYKA
jgi:hypothetical protein